MKTRTKDEMLRLDGNRLDLSFYHLDKVNDLLSDSLTEVLVDKDDRIPLLPPANESSYFIKKPTQELYDGCYTGFPLCQERCRV